MNFATDYPALEGRPVTQGHADHCATKGHATYTCDGVVGGTCPRCGVVLETAEWTPRKQSDAVRKYLLGKGVDPKSFAVSSEKTNDRGVVTYVMPKEGTYGDDLPGALARLKEALDGYAGVIEQQYDSPWGRLTVSERKSKRASYVPNRMAAMMGVRDDLVELLGREDGGWDMTPTEKTELAKRLRNLATLMDIG